MAQMIEHWTPAGPVKSPADIPLDQITREEVRARAMVGDASALGLLGFATGTFTVSAIATGWFAAGDIPWTVPVLLVFAGIAQFIAGMWAFRRGDVFGGTAFGAFGAFNTTFAFWDLTMHPATLGGSAAAAPINGIWIACFSYIALALFFVALRRGLALALVLLALAGTYGFLAASVFDYGNILLEAIGGWCGIASSILAFYTATAMLINAENMRSLIPMGSMMQATVPDGASARPAPIREEVR
ncbi:MAG TPA: acetate uptake transporter [Chloroflexota bacterium]|nr:acetate uptake transporter [Chloroflexota bacterium]